MGKMGTGARPWHLRRIRFRPEGAACRGEAAPRPYIFVAYPDVIDGLGTDRVHSQHDSTNEEHPPRGWRTHRGKV